MSDHGYSRPPARTPAEKRRIAASYQRTARQKRGAITRLEQELDGLVPRMEVLPAGEVKDRLQRRADQIIGLLRGLEG